jgi:hypothetical protein
MDITIVHEKTKEDSQFFGSTPETVSKSDFILTAIAQVWGDRVVTEYTNDTRNTYTFKDTTIDELGNFLAQYKDIFDEIDAFHKENNVVTTTSVPTHRYHN